MVREIRKVEYIAEPRASVPVAEDPYLATSPLQEWAEALVQRAGLSSRQVPQLGTYYEGLRQGIDLRVRHAVGLCQRAGQCSVQATIQPCNPDVISGGSLESRCGQRAFGDPESAVAAEKSCGEHYASAPERVANMIREDLAKLTAPVAEA